MTPSKRKISKSLCILILASWITLAISAPAVLGQMKAQEISAAEGSLSGRDLSSVFTMGVLSPTAPDCGEPIADYAAVLRTYSLPPAWSLPPELDSLPGGASLPTRAIRKSWK